MQKKIYLNLCIKSITENITEKEQKTLNDWLEKSDSHRKEFEQLKHTWLNIKINEQRNLPNVNSEWQRLNDRINDQNESLKTKQKWFEFNPEKLFKPVYKPAIAVVILMVLIAVYVLQINEEPIRTISESTLFSEKREIVLPDSSTVLLNYSSKIEYPEQFGEVRKVKLQGEAFFSITKNKNQFRVITNNAVVTVLGTKFSVKSEDIKTDIFVKEGKVNIKQLKSDNVGLVVTTGQRSTVEKNQLPSEPEFVNANDALSWINDVLTFNQTPLNEVKSELEKLYGIPITLSDEGSNSLTLTGSFRYNMPLDSVLDLICMALELHHEKVLDNYIISRK